MLISTLYEARTKLEAAGYFELTLVEFKEPRCSYFELIEPLKPDQFFQDDYEYFITRYYRRRFIQEFTNEFILTTDMPTDSKDISKSF